MAVNRTSLSAGAIIREILLQDEEVSARANKIFPVVTDKAELPYILYRRSAMGVTPQKAGQPGADEVKMEILCFTDRYSEGIELAEAVRSALDCKTMESDGLRLRGCYLSDSEEAWQDDAYVQQMEFTIKI